MENSSPSAENQSLARTILMVRPNNFRSNEMTSTNNFYQSKDTTQSPSAINQHAITEFDSLSHALQQTGVQVVVVQDDPQQDTPDSCFPNNWISFHPTHKYILYPMYAENRRLERQLDIFTPLKQHSIHPQLLKDYSEGESKGVFLEGTGSLILDSVSKIAYAALSCRTN